MKKTITIPDSWSEITIGQYQEISMQDPESKDYLLNITSIILDKDPEEIRKYDVNSANAIMRHLEWAIKLPSDQEYKQELIVDGQSYYLVENLNKFSNGEWFDLEYYMEEQEKNIHYLFAMFYRPAGEEYSASKIKERANIFSEKVMVGDVYGALVFFSTVAKKSMLTTQDYLMNLILPE